MNPMTPKSKERLVQSGIRLSFVVAMFLALIAFVKYTGADYETLRTLLGIVNGYFPELLAIMIAVGIAIVFYRASISRNDFNFIYFFVSKPGVHEDLWKFGYFVLLVTCVWILFTLAWRDKLTAEVIGVILGAFILKNLADVGGKIWGRPKPPDPEEKEKP